MSSRGSRVLRSPASTARAMVVAYGTVAVTGMARTASMSLVSSARPGSLMSTMAVAGGQWLRGAGRENRAG